MINNGGSKRQNEHRATASIINNLQEDLNKNKEYLNQSSVKSYYSKDTETSNPFNIYASQKDSEFGKNSDHECLQNIYLNFSDVKGITSNKRQSAFGGLVNNYGHTCESNKEGCEDIAIPDNL